MYPAIVAEQMANLVVIIGLVALLVYMVLHLKNLFAQEEGEETSDDNNDNGGQ